MSLELPVEITLNILELALHNCPVPSNLLRVNSAFRNFGLLFLYTHLRLPSMGTLTRFINAHDTFTHQLVVACHPRTITLDVPGVPHLQTFGCLKQLFALCQRITCKELGGPLLLEQLSLRLHSQKLERARQDMCSALLLVNPRRFIWTGPDPDHHFSIAIVPEAAERLLAAATYWDRLEHLTISNVSFPVPPTLDASTSRPLSIPPLLPAALPGLQTITISQATALSPLSIASLLAMKDPGMDALTRVRLVDTYEISIWGKRLRRGDVEQAAERRVLAQGQGAEEIMRAVKRVRSVVICEARLERIIGGDRVEGTTVLE